MVNMPAFGMLEVRPAHGSGVSMEKGLARVAPTTSNCRRICDRGLEGGGRPEKSTHADNVDRGFIKRGCLKSEKVNPPIKIEHAYYSGLTI